MAIFCVAPTLAGDWPCWRGPDYNGISAETGFKTTWEESRPAILWEANIGSAYSSLTCVNDKVYTCGIKDGKQMLYCLAGLTGKEIWSQVIEENYKSNWGDGTRGTPTIDQERVYAWGAHGTLVCCDAKTGKTIWSQKYNNEPKWGYSGSVLIRNNLAIISPGKDQGSLCALDKNTGKMIWKSGNDIAGYATPYPFNFGGTDYVCGFTGKSAIIVKEKDGTEVLTIPWETDWDVNAATPIYSDGHLFLSSGYKTGCALFKLVKTGKKLSTQEIWRSKALMNKFQTPVLYKGKLYSSDQKSMKCVDFLTGKEHWEKNRIKHGTVLLADGQIILLTEKGTLQIGPARTDDFVPTGVSQILEGRCWTIPTLSNGRLYARNLDKVVCVDLSK